MVTIKQISNFLVLAKTLHIAKAAHELGISQATLSGEIKIASGYSLCIIATIALIVNLSRQGII